MCTIVDKLGMAGWLGVCVQWLTSWEWRDGWEYVCTMVDKLGMAGWLGVCVRRSVCGGTA